MAYLILVRHGQSRWNLDNKFTGMVDVPLSPKGQKEAMESAGALAGIDIDIAFTSTLVRAQQTLLTIFEQQKRTGIFMPQTKRDERMSRHPHTLEKGEVPIYVAWALNERNYGDLQGMNKNAARKRFGQQQVHLWRRSWDINPPNGESLKDTSRRSVRYFNRAIHPEVQAKKNVLVAAHGNSLRSIIKYIEGISNEDIPHLELPTGVPIIYRFTRGKYIRESDEHKFERPIEW